MNNISTHIDAYSSPIFLMRSILVAPLIVDVPHMTTTVSPERTQFFSNSSDSAWETPVFMSSTKGLENEIIFQAMDNN